jgi:ATP-dependent DNA helicase DinG
VTKRTLSMLGATGTAVDWHEAPSPFDVHRRPIYCFRDTPRIRIDHRVTAEMLDWWVFRIDEWLERRHDRKGIIHTVSYARQRAILERSQFARYMLAPGKSADVPPAVERFKTAPAPAILLSPSIMTGFDFPGDTCEYQVVSKVPFPDTRSEIAKARAAADPDFGPHTTMQALVQAVGRGMRAQTDRCETLIIDDHIHWFLRKHHALAPTWFLDAVQTVSTMPDPAPKLQASQKE